MSPIKKSTDVKTNNAIIQILTVFKEPILLNVNTNRLFWHSGAGIDSNKVFDRYKSLFKIFGKRSISFDNKTKIQMKNKFDC